jgi:cullin 1
MSQGNRPTIVDLDEGWAEMETGIHKLKRILADEPNVAFASGEYMHLYTYAPRMHWLQ